jgi:hypothetical protein
MCTPPQRKMLLSLLGRGLRQSVIIIGPLGLVLDFRNKAEPSKCEAE